MEARPDGSHDATRQDNVMTGHDRHGTTRHGTARHDTTRHDTTRRDTTMTRRDTTRHGPSKAQGGRAKRLDKEGAERAVHVEAHVLHVP